MKCGDKEWQHSRVEKMGCYGCNYDEKGEKKKMKEIGIVHLLENIRGKGWKL